MSAPKLHDYGIQNEQSDIRAHVGVRARTVYVFRTEEAKRLVASMRKDEGRFASQPGVVGPTAFGFAVPVSEQCLDERTIDGVTTTQPKRPWGSQVAVGT